MSWKVFFITQTPFALERLRRFNYDLECSASVFDTHDAETVLGETDFPLGDTEGSFGDNFSHDDPRWPTRCKCGYEFTDEDEWQHGLTRIYAGGDWRGILNDAPVGAMWDAHWMKSWAEGPDGRALTVRLPDKVDWTIDAPTRGGGHWSRSGEPPFITAHPSILTPGYHGFLRDGVLTDDLDKRTY